MRLKGECRRVYRLLWNYAEGSLTPQETLRVERHLTTCADCVRQAKGFAATTRLMQSGRQEMPALYGADWTSLHERLENRPQLPLPPRLFRSTVRRLTLGGATLALLLLLPLLRYREQVFASGAPRSVSMAGQTMLPSSAPGFQASTAGPIQRMESPLRTGAQRPSLAQGVTEDFQEEEETPAQDLSRFGEVIGGRERGGEASFGRPSLGRGFGAALGIPDGPPPEGPGGAGVSPLKSLGESALPADPRLDRKAIVSAEGIPVGDLLERLSAKTAVAFHADPTVADEKVIVFGPARPLRTILADLAALFGAEWQAKFNPQGQRAYRLTRSQAVQDYESRLASALPQRIEKGLEVYVRALEEPEAQRNLRDKDDLIRVYTGNAASRLAGRIYQDLTPAQRKAFLTHRHLVVPFDTLLPERKQGLRAEYGKYIEENKRRRKEEPGGYPYPIGSVEELEGSLLRFDLSLLHSGYLPRIAFGQGASLFFGRVDSRETYLAAPHGNPYTGAPPPANAALPPADLLQQAAQQAHWTDQLKKLSADSGMPILADYYRSRPLILEYKAALEGAAPSFGLDSFCQPAGYLWWTRGRTLLFRKRDWYDQRRYEVSDRWVLETIRSVEAHGDHPTFADVFRLRELTFPQMMGLCGDSDEVLQYDTFSYSGAPELLAIVQSAIVNPNAPIPEAGVERPDEEMAAAWPLNALSLHQKPLLDAFLRELHYDLDLPGSHAQIFRAEIGYGGLPKNRERYGYRYHRIDLEAKYDRDETHYFAQLSLPATLIDDRRDQTQIEWAR